VTNYVILHRSAEGGDWTESGAVEARSAAHAIQVYATGDGTARGQFVAIPSRTWTPRTVAVETRHTVKVT
jgi:hypothetical protein